MARETSDANFETDVINAGKPVLVDFWAEWCGPCRQVAPILDQLSDELGDKIDIVKVNIDKNPEAPSKHGVRSIPTLMIFQDGKPVATKVGALPKTALEEWINEEVA